jgi:hypothetical protein
MFFKKSKTVGVPVEVYKIFKELADKHENIQVINNDGVIELRDPRLPYFPIIWIGKGVMTYDPNTSESVVKHVNAR